MYVFDFLMNFIIEPDLITQAMSRLGDHVPGIALTGSEEVLNQLEPNQQNQSWQPVIAITTAEFAFKRHKRGFRSKREGSK